MGEQDLDTIDNILMKSRVDLAARNLLKKKLPFNMLCRTLSKLQLIIEKGCHNYTDNDTRIMKDKIINSELEYDEICWLIAYLRAFLNIQNEHDQK